MTEEELKNKLISEAQASWNKLNITKRVCGSEFSYYDGYVDCGTIKEKQIQIDAEQIRALQKQNGELTDELTLTNNECKKMREELKQRIRENQKLCEQIEKGKVVEHFEAYGQCRDSRRIAELEAQIEKMKRCAICKHSTDLGYCKIRCSGGECDNHSSWEIKEND